MSDLYATIIHVPADFPTISSAISAASPGDTIIVAAGVYNEHVVIDVADLTLLGAQANVDARTRTYIPANESIITFASPAFGSGIVNIASPNVIFNGFTVQGNGTIVNSTGAIFAGDAGVFLPSTTTIDVTGLQLLNNIVQNNANGILIASIEPTPKTPNYLVQFNYFQNNSGDPNSGNGQGVFFNNSAGTVMTNVTVTENLFNGMESGSSVNLQNVTTATVSYNVMNQDNSIVLLGTTGVSIIGNVTSGATGTNSNTADAIIVGFGCSNTTITDNLIYTATSNGINIFQGNSNITITDNCIVGNTLAGISLSSEGIAANSNITINNNNIRMNTTGLNLGAGSYTSPPLLDATSNYWNSALGPNYNGTSPGAGDLITDNNIPATQTVQYTPFLTNAIVCPSPVTLTNTTTSVNVPPGTPVSFVVTITVAAGETSFNAVSFTDPLPSLASGSAWTIATQSPSGFFTITGAVGSQNLALTTTLPSQIAPGTYTVTLTANTTMSDAGETLPSTATMTIQIEGTTGIRQNISDTATASVAVCIHKSSLVLLANGLEIEIYKLRPGEEIMGADGRITKIVDSVPCWIENKGTCVIFEPNSLGLGVPSKRFAVDSGHPVCSPDEYINNGHKFTKVAKSYIGQNSGIYGTTWDQVESLLPGENERYDIIMPNDSCKAYIANGVVVQARQSRKDVGYHYD
jgi:hypothetical protein